MIISSPSKVWSEVDNVALPVQPVLDRHRPPLCPEAACLHEPQVSAGHPHPGPPVRQLQHDHGALQPGLQDPGWVYD